MSRFHALRYIVIELSAFKVIFIVRLIFLSLFPGRHPFVEMLEPLMGLKGKQDINHPIRNLQLNSKIVGFQKGFLEYKGRTWDL